MTEVVRSPTNYPRVLIVSLNRINQSDQDSAAFLLRNIFGDWPRECLGQIFTSQDNGDEGFCRCYYQLGPNDRVLGSVFQWLRRRSGHSERVLASQEINTVISRTTFLQKVKSYWANWFMKTQVYEFFFPLRLSPGLREWILRFSPDVIYATGYTLGLAALSTSIAEEFKVPLTIHWSDDWPSKLLAAAPRILRRAAYEPTIARLVQRASHRWVFSAMMANEYRLRYKYEFRVVMNGDLPSRFPEPKEVNKANAFSVVLCGNFGIERWRSLDDICRACTELCAEGYGCSVLVYATDLPLEARDELSHYSILQLKPSPSHHELPKYLTEADVLAIIEPFDEHIASEMRFSISTKAHLFMMARRPILVYAPEITGISQYASLFGFASVVDKKDICSLKDKLKTLLLDSCYRNAIISKAWLLALNNHDIKQIRQVVFDSMCSPH